MTICIREVSDRAVFRSDDIARWAIYAIGRFKPFPQDALLEFGVEGGAGDAQLMTGGAHPVSAVV